MEQPVDGFPRRNDCGECDDDDEQAGEVLGSAETIGVAAARDPATKDERAPERSAVRASEKVWIVSASSATELLSGRVANWKIVMPSRTKGLIFSSRPPRALASNASSIEPSYDLLPVEGVAVPRRTT